MLLYFVTSKNGTKCKNFAVLLCFYVNTLILLYFLRFQEGGPLATPLNSPLNFLVIYLGCTPSKALIYVIVLVCWGG